MIDDQIRELALDPDLELRRARRRPARPRRACRPSTACGRCAGCGARSPRSARATQTRIAEDFPREIQPLVEEINELLAHSEAQAEEARRHAGNLAHALKTPLTVITNAATAHAPDLADTVCREATVDAPPGRPPSRPRPRHRPPRLGPGARHGVGQRSRRSQRAVDRLYEDVTVDIAGDKTAQVRVERQDLDEMLGNLVENAAKYGGGRVFVTVEPGDGQCVDIMVEDDGPGIPRQSASRSSSAARGSTPPASRAPASASPSSATSPRSTAAAITLEESEDLGGLLARLTPARGLGKSARVRLVRRP